MESKKAFFTNSVIYIVLGFLPMGVNFILSPFYTYYLTPQEYGLIGIAELFNGFISVFLALGIQQGVARFYFDYAFKPKVLHSFISSVLLLLLLIACFIGLVFTYFGDGLFSITLSNNLFRFYNYGWLVLISSASIIIQGVFLSWYRNSENIKMYVLTSLTYFVLTVSSIVIGVIVLEKGAMGNIAGRAIGAGFSTMVFLVYFFFKYKVAFEFRFVKPLLKYGLPLVPYALVLYAYNSIDKYLVERYFDLNTLGIYNFAFLLSSVISVYIYSVFNAISPKIYKELKSSSVKKSEISYLIDAQVLSTLGVICLVVLFSQPLIQFFIDKEYAQSGEILLLFAISFVPQVYYVIYSIPMFFYKRTQLLPFISLISLILGGVLSYFLIVNYGIWGACFGAVGIKMIQILILFLFSFQKGLFNQFNYLSIKSMIISILVSFSILASLALAKEGGLSLMVTNTLPFLVFVLAMLLSYADKVKQGAKSVKSFNLNKF